MREGRCNACSLLYPYFIAGGIWPVVAAAGGLALAGGTGGVKGLESFAAGFAGGLAGGMLGGYLNKAINSSIAQAADYQSNVNQDADTMRDADDKLHTLTGRATCYDFTGNQRADNEDFDPDSDSAAMTKEKGTFGKTVSIVRLDSNGQAITQPFDVEINDTGPFARGPDNRALIPLRPDPNLMIDLTPQVYWKLTGFYDCGDGPGKIIVRIQW